LVNERKKQEVRRAKLSSKLAGKMAMVTSQTFSLGFNTTQLPHAMAMGIAHRGTCERKHTFVHTKSNIAQIVSQIRLGEKNKTTSRKKANKKKLELNKKIRREAHSHLTIAGKLKGTM
jgi:hypothetical protein